MVFILGNEKLLTKSKFYDEKNCWDYPLEELDHVIESNTEPDMVYVVGEDKRIYETDCKDYELYDLYEELNLKPELRRFELAAISVCIKLYVKYGMEAAMDKLEKWNDSNKSFEPNLKLVKEHFNHIIKPYQSIQEARLQQTSENKEYRVKIREVAEMEIPVIAENMEDAINKVEQQYSDREIAFEYDNYEDLDIKATEIIKVNRDEIGLSGDIYFSYDGVRNFKKLQNTSIHELESAGEIATMIMEENPLNVALIAEENTFYLISYLYNEEVKKVEHIDNYKIDISSMNEEEFKNVMYNYYINTYFQYLNYIEEYEEEEMVE